MNLRQHGGQQRCSVFPVQRMGTGQHFALVVHRFLRQIGECSEQALTRCVFVQIEQCSGFKGCGQPFVIRRVWGCLGLQGIQTLVEHHTFAGSGCNFAFEV
jgi:hypothetical protein